MSKITALAPEGTMSPVTCWVPYDVLVTCYCMAVRTDRASVVCMRGADNL